MEELDARDAAALIPAEWIDVEDDQDAAAEDETEDDAGPEAATEP